MNDEAESRFWAQVNKDGPVARPELGPCWLFTGPVSGGTRYGSFYLGRDVGKHAGAHRFSWALANGTPPAGLDVCHHCDVRLCVNPGHLFLGTRKDNLQDMSRKGRFARPGAKLTPAIVEEIRRRYAAGTRQRDLAAEFGVGQPTISRIATRSYWRATT